MHLSRQLNCRSLRCSWSIACRRCSNYIFALDLTPGFIALGEDNCTTRRATSKFGDLVRLILEILRYIKNSDTNVITAGNVSEMYDITMKAVALPHIQTLGYITEKMYYQTSNIRCTLLGNKIVDHSDVVGASPVGAAPTTSSFLT